MSEAHSERERVDAGMKILVANEMVQKYELPTDAREKLLQSEGADQMELIAARMALEKEKLGRQQSTKVASGIGSKPLVDINKKTPSEQIRWGVEHDS